MDPIGDMLTRIRNAYQRRRKSVELPHSQMKENLAQLLVREGYLEKARNFKESGRPGKMLHLDLKYESGEPAISGIRRLSRPGQRLYASAGTLVTKLRGITIVSTSQGLLTAREARKKGLGGELIGEVM